MSKAYSSVILSSNGKFKPPMRDDQPDLPTHYTKKLTSNLKEILKNKTKKNIKLTDKEIE